MSVSLKKILILEEEAVIALDIKYILLRSGTYFPVIVKNGEEIFSSIIDGTTELIITSLNIFGVISEGMLNKLNMKVILLDNICQADSEEDSSDFRVEVISKPFTAEVLISKVEQLLGKTAANENVYVNT